MTSTLVPTHMVLVPSWQVYAAKPILILKWITWVAMCIFLPWYFPVGALVLDFLLIIFHNKTLRVEKYLPFFEQKIEIPNQEAIKAFEQANRIKPDDAEAHFKQGVAYGELGCFKDAAEALKKAIRIEPDLYEPHYNLGVVYAELGRYKKAIKTYKEAVRINPGYAEAHYNLGLIYTKLDHHQEAVEALEQAIRIKPNFAEAHACLGGVYSSLDDRDSAIQEYNILKELNQELADKLFEWIYK